MTSPVDTSVKLFTDLMPNGPILQKQPGSGVALLDACLVSGYDVKTASSLVVVGGVATLSHTGTHAAMEDTVILISGVTGALAALNGEQKISTKGVGTLTFPTAAADGTAAGTISFKMAPAGWEIVYTATNVRVYRSLDPTSSKMLIRVDDSGVNGQPGYMRVRAYETMTDINTGTNAFPPNPDIAEDATNGGFWPKGYDGSANTIPISWSVFADSKMFYWAPATYTGESTSYAQFTQGNLFGFGEMRSRRLSGDPFAVAICAGRKTSDVQSYPQSGNFSHGEDGYGRIWVARDYTGLGPSKQMLSRGYGQVNDTDLSGATNGGGYGTFPSAVDGSLFYGGRYIHPRVLNTLAEWAPRADVPGLYYIPQYGCFPLLSRGGRVVGIAPIAGRKLYVQNIGSPTANPTGIPQSIGTMLIDVTGPWR